MKTNKNESFKLFICYFEFRLLWELKSGEELNDRIEELFDLIVVFLQEIEVRIVFGQFVDEIFHDCVLLNSRLFFALFMLNAIIHMDFLFVNTFFTIYSLFFENLVCNQQNATRWRKKLRSRFNIYRSRSEKSGADRQWSGCVLLSKEKIKKLIKKTWRITKSVV